MKYWRKPLDIDKCKTPKGEIHIIADRCKGCNFCIEFCPTDVLIESERFNVKGYHPPEIKYPDNCIGCKLCELICPDFSIYVIVDDPTVSEQNKSKSKSKKGSSEVAVDA
jgi:2-oxoglutarate ferredoxin oxidoreductase subunit delta